MRGLKSSIYNPHPSPLLEGEGIFRDSLNSIGYVAAFVAFPRSSEMRTQTKPVWRSFNPCSALIWEDCLLIRNNYSCF
jgi:hypothetical protein